jgi:hypothetical protein
LLGVGGLLDPAIVLSLKDVELPFRSRAIGIGLAVVGLILGLILHITLFLQ